ncbi:MAG: hypothetical protein HQL51_13770 [Magnetococcales bacterium]|nr:hypothetical protein [Magnetococcales bacterium]
MERQGIRTIVAAVLAACFPWVVGGAAEIEISEKHLVVQGGKLYDNWGQELKKRPPRETHPAYPTLGKKKGMDTWRCKACHGWDYRGKDGAFGDKGSEHYTGIKGIRGWMGQEPEKAAAILRDANHRYTPDLLSEASIKALSVFVTRGQLEMEPWIVDGKVKGDAQKGRVFYQTICYRCHGLDGKKINFGDEKEPEYLGGAARGNPWEALHKIRNGQPGEDMITLGAMSVETQVDVLAYLLTLPEK